MNWFDRLFQATSAQRWTDEAFGIKRTPGIVWRAGSGVPDDATGNQIEAAFREAASRSAPWAKAWVHFDLMTMTTAFFVDGDCIHRGLLRRGVDADPMVLLTDALAALSDYRKRQIAGRVIQAELVL